MAEIPISSLTALAVAPASGDLFAIVDVSDATQAPTGTTKKITLATILTAPTFTGAVNMTGTLTVVGSLQSDAGILTRGLSVHTSGSLDVLNGLVTNLSGVLNVTGLATLTAGATSAQAITFTGTTVGGAGSMYIGPAGDGLHVNAPTGGAVTVTVNNSDILTMAAASVTAAKTLITVLSATGAAGFRLPHGAAPSAPVNGDVWTTTAGLFVRINGATVGPLT